MLLLAAGAATVGAAEPGSPVTIEGDVTIEGVEALGEQDLRLELRATNRGAEPIDVVVAEVLLRYAGGWLEPAPGAGAGPLAGPLPLAAGGAAPLGLGRLRTPGPATHLLLRVRAAGAEAWNPLPLEGTVGEAAGPAALDLGLVAPLEAVRLADGRHVVLLTGQHVLGAGAAPEGPVRTQVRLVGDAGASLPLAFGGLGRPGPLPYAYTFVRSLEVHEGFGRGVLTIEARVGEAVAVAQSHPVARVEPVRLAGPVLGAWQLANGPAQPGAAPHAVTPARRYGYDLVIMDKGRTFRGDPFDNRSYFAWNRSVLAAADGEVVYVCDHEPDGPGYRALTGACFDNRVVLRHAGGVYTAYRHLRQGSVSERWKRGDRVRAGQVLGRVGNSGDSREPHLAFLAFTLEEGRLRALPVAFTNAYEDARAAAPLDGVAPGGWLVTFR